MQYDVTGRIICISKIVKYFKNEASQILVGLNCMKFRCLISLTNMAPLQSFVTRVFLFLKQKFNRVGNRSKKLLHSFSILEKDTTTSFLMYVNIDVLLSFTHCISYPRQAERILFHFSSKFVKLSRPFLPKSVQRFCSSLPAR